MLSEWITQIDPIIVAICVAINCCTRILVAFDQSKVLGFTGESKIFAHLRTMTKPREGKREKKLHEAISISSILKIKLYIKKQELFYFACEARARRFIHLAWPKKERQDENG